VYYPRVVFVVDDVPSVEPWTVRESKYEVKRRVAQPPRLVPGQLRDRPAEWKDCMGVGVAAIDASLS
jgi:hypothetical protein